MTAPQSLLFGCFGAIQVAIASAAADPAPTTPRNEHQQHQPA